MPTMDSIDIRICQPCAAVICNGECGYCQLHDVDPCPHGGNERIPATAVTVDGEEACGWVMNVTCYLCDETSDGDQWYAATLWVDELPPLVSLVKDEFRSRMRSDFRVARQENRYPCGGCAWCKGER